MEIALSSRARPIGAPQAAILISAPLFAMLGSTIIAPLLATIQVEYGDVAHAELLVPLLLTAPALFLALLSPVVGLLLQRVSARSLLLTTMLLYGVAGIAPIFIQSLYGIFAARLLLGVAEAGLVTSALTLLSQYFQGDERQKWVVYQNACLPWLGAAIIAATGVLGDLNWRYTFLMYGLVFIPLTAGLLLLPKTEPSQVSTPTILGVNSRAKFPWRRILLVAAIAIPGSLTLNYAPVQLAFLLRDLGVTQPSSIANITAIGLLLGPVGAFMSRGMTRMSVGKLLSTSMTMMGSGLVVMAMSQTVPLVTLGIVVQQAGGGLFFATAMTYVLSLAQPHDRGLYAGAWWFFYTLTLFVTPLVVMLLMGAVGDRAQSVVVMGVLALTSCIWLLLASPLRGPLVAENATEK